MKIYMFGQLIADSDDDEIKGEYIMNKEMVLIEIDKLRTDLAMGKCKLTRYELLLQVRNSISSL